MKYDSELFDKWDKAMREWINTGEFINPNLRHRWKAKANGDEPLKLTNYQKVKRERKIINIFHPSPMLSNQNIRISIEGEFAEINPNTYQLIKSLYGSKNEGVDGILSCIDRSTPSPKQLIKAMAILPPIHDIDYEEV